MSDQQAGGELNSALRHVLESKRQEAVETRAAIEAARRREASRVPTLLMVVVGWSVLAWMWIAKPALIFNVAETPVHTPQQVEATARFALFLEKSRVENYLKTHGRLPAQLSEAGPVEAGVVYQRAGTGYVLSREANGVPLRLTSSMNADSFLGNSLQVLRASE